MDKWRRRNYFIDKSFQAKFIIKFCVIVVISSFVIGASIFYLSTDFTTVAIERAHVIVKSTSDFMLPIVIETLALVTLFAAIAVILLTLLTSHKIAGPLYRLKSEIEKFKSGQLNITFRTRSTDQLQDLTESLSDMSKILTDRHVGIKHKLSELRNSIEKPGTDKDAIMKKLIELESDISYFKI